MTIDNGNIHIAYVEYAFEMVNMTDKYITFY